MPAAGVDQRCRRIQAQRFCPPYRIKQGEVITQGIIHLAVTDAKPCTPASKRHFITKIIIMQIFIAQHPACKNFIADPAGIIKRCLKTITVPAAVFAAVVIAVHNMFGSFSVMQSDCQIRTADRFTGTQNTGRADTRQIIEIIKYRLDPRSSDITIPFQCSSQSSGRSIGQARIIFDDYFA